MIIRLNISTLCEAFSVIMINEALLLGFNTSGSQPLLLSYKITRVKFDAFSRPNSLFIFPLKNTQKQKY